MADDPQEKSHQMVALSPDEHGANHAVSVSDLLATNQQPEEHHTTTEPDLQVSDVSGTVGESRLVKARDSPPESQQDLMVYLTTTISRHIACAWYQALAVALWIIMSWCQSAFRVSPLLAITAMTKGAGKTQLLTLIEYLCRNPLKVGNTRGPGLFRSIEEFDPTLLIDEADSFIKANDDIRGIIDTGFEVDSYVIRCDPNTFKPVKFKTFCPKAIAGIGNLPDTMQDRSIVINMRRKRKDEVKIKLRRADMQEFDEIKRRIEQWVVQHADALSSINPEMPDGLSDRKEDCWEPLFAIADVFGGEYPELARQAALKISGVDYDEGHINEQLLRAIRAAFEQKNVTRLQSQVLLESLWADDEAPWLSFNKGKPMTIRQLSQLLRPFGVGSKQIRFGDKTLKGYELADFEGCFRDYLPD